MTTQRFFGQHFEINTLDAAGRAFETTRNNIFAQTDRFKNLCAFVRVQCRDTDFRHHFQHAFSNTFAIGRDNFIVVILLGIQQAFAL